MLGHILKHGKHLWGHEISLPAEIGGGMRLVDRTNNSLESFFDTMKHDERRRGGRKNLAKIRSTSRSSAAPWTASPWPSPVWTARNDSRCWRDTLDPPAPPRPPRSESKAPRYRARTVD
jgi:hypothetical protein